MNKLRRIKDRLHDERGSLSAYVLITVVILIVVTGLVVDSAGKYQEDAHAQQIASNAARAAVNSISGDTVYNGSLNLNVAQAESVARNYLAAADVEGTVTVAGQIVSVDVKTTYRTKFLSLIGADTLPGKGSASAELITQ
jgi:Flp pilus assembly protein TadG